MKKLHKFLCPKCEREISAPCEDVGQTTRCDFCEAVIVIPTIEKDRQLREEIQHRGAAAPGQRQPDAEKEARRERDEEESEKRYEDGKETAAETAARELAFLERFAETGPKQGKGDAAKVHEVQQLVKSANSLCGWLVIFAVLFWIAMAINAFLAVLALTYIESRVVFYSFLAAAALCALWAKVLGGIADWIATCSTVTARMFVAARREAAKPDQK